MVGYENWFDFKRTGLPKQTLPLDNRNPGGSTKIPSRFYYPETEQAVNKSQYEAALKAEGENREKAHGRCYRDGWIAFHLY